jgi:hypothetical protein
MTRLFFNNHYFNHRVLQHGNLTGMVHFQTTSPWAPIKITKGTYFQWHMKFSLTIPNSRLIHWFLVASLLARTLGTLAMMRQRKNYMAVLGYPKMNSLPTFLLADLCHSP